MSGRVFLVAAEASGDALGADLIHALRARDSGIVFGGVGGSAMEAAGVNSAIAIDGLAVLGLIDGLKAYPRVVKLSDAAADAVVAFNPDVVVLIDSWGFTLRVAQRIGTRLPKVPLVKYVGPQVWATRAGRAKTLAAAVDHLICIFAFEAPFYAPYNLPCTVSGHPALGRTKQGDGAAFRARHDLPADKPILLMLPGSRRSEIRRVAPVLEEAAAKLCAERPDLIVSVVVAPSVSAEVRARAQMWRFPHILVVESGEKDDAFAAATAAIVASGTVSTELALQGAPMVIGYKLGWVTWALARYFLFKAPYITLFNIAAKHEAAPELMQTRFTAENVAAAARVLLDDPAKRAAQVQAQFAALDAMGRGKRPAAEIAADAVLDVMKRGPLAVRR